MSLEAQTRLEDSPRSEDRLQGAPFLEPGTSFTVANFETFFFVVVAGILHLSTQSQHHVPRILTPVLNHSKLNLVLYALYLNAGFCQKRRRHWSSNNRNKASKKHGGHFEKLFGMVNYGVYKGLL
jgi:hypothetical protein